MERSILHLDLDTFFVSVERLLSPELLKKPVLVGGTGGRGVVAACSYETRKFGVHSGMSMKLARQLCPEAICIKGNSSTYMKYSDLITEIINESVPIFEKTSVDEFYVDLTGMDRFFGNYALATELRQRIIKESGLPISFGLSPNKTVSKVATGEAKPNNQMRVDAGFEKLFLAPLSIRKIPNVGKVTGQKLIAMGVERIKTIQQMPVEMLTAVLGKNGQKILQRAQGIDDSLVKPYSERKSISSERTFNLDTIDITRLKNTVTTMVDTLCFQLRQANKEHIAEYLKSDPIWEIFGVKSQEDFIGNYVTRGKFHKNVPQVIQKDYQLVEPPLPPVCDWWHGKLSRSINN